MMSQAEIKALSGEITKALKPMVMDLLARNALSAVTPVNEMDRPVTCHELRRLLGSANQPNGGKAETF